MPNFIKHYEHLNIAPLLYQMEAHPELWNLHPERKLGNGSPHAAMSDIWVRFRPKHELVTPKSYEEFFIPAWYPARRDLPQVEVIALGLMGTFHAVQLGGVLITKIPPGGRILPHNDRGRWHPEFFNTKLYIPLMANDNCINVCENESVVMRMGECWEFDNLKEHSVENNGTTDRATLIICMRTEP